MSRRVAIEPELVELVATVIEKMRGEGVAYPDGIHPRPKSSPVARTEASEARYGWWTGNNSIGQPFQGRYPDEETSPVRSILNIDQFGIPQVMTLALNRDAIINTTGNSDVFAVVEYGQGSFNDSFELDFANGIQASIMASSLRVGFAPEAVDLSAAYSQGTTQLSLSAAGGKFPAPNALPPTRTIRSMRNAAGWALQRSQPAGFTTPSATRNVPPFARSLFVAGLTGTFDPGAAVVFTDIRGSTLLTLTLDQFDNLRQVFLPSGVYQFRLTQGAFPYAFSPIAYNWVFQLGL